MLNRFLIVGLVTALCFVNGCKGSKASQSDSGQEQPEEVQPKSDTDGVIVAAIATDKAQLLKASASGGLAGTEIVFPAGALAISTDVTLTEGAALDLAASKSELGIGDGIEMAAASSTILITVADAQDLLKPVTVTTTLAEGASLAPQGKKYALLSHVTKAGAATIMINANLEFRIDNNKISFPISFFGAHSVVLVPEGFGETKEAPTVRPLPDKKGSETPDPNPVPTPTALSVVSMVPAAGTQVALPVSIELTFSEAVDSATASAAVSVTRGAGMVTGSISVNGTKVMFSPAQSFILGQSYTVAVANTMKSVSGAVLASAYSASFSVKEGAWSATTAAVASETDANYAALAPLNAGRYGIVKTQPSTSIDTYLFDGTAWGPKATFSDANVGEFESVLGVGGHDGRFYILGRHSSKPYIMRYNPALAAPKLLTDGLSPAPASMTSFSVVAVGQGEALYFYIASGQAFVRSLKGDVLGAAESIGAIASYPYPVIAGSVQGGATVAGIRVANGQNSLKVFHRTSAGLWSDLTPNGDELTGDLRTNPFSVFVNNAGNPTIFWCINELTEVNICNLSAHDGTSWSAIKSFNPATNVNGPTFLCDETGRTCGAVWSEAVSEMKTIYGSVFKSNAWNTPTVIATSSLSDPMASMDRVGRILVTWINDDYIMKYVMYNGSAWSAAANTVASEVVGVHGLAGDSSGGFMALITKQNAQQATELHTVQFK